MYIFKNCIAFINCFNSIYIYLSIYLSIYIFSIKNKRSRKRLVILKEHKKGVMFILAIKL